MTLKQNLTSFGTLQGLWLGGLGVAALAGYIGFERLAREDEWINRWAPPMPWGSTQLPVVAGRALGWRSLAADLLWMRAVQYLDESAHAKEGYGRFKGMVHDVVSVDPYCVQAYASGSAVLMWVVKDTQAAMELLKEGIRHNPGYARFGLYLAAFTYYRSDQFVQTIGILESLMEDEQHPIMLEPILGNLYLKMEKKEKARQLWWWMWYHSRSDDNRQYAKRHLEQHGFWQP